MNYIKFDKEKLKNFLKEHKDKVNEIFSNQENLNKLENNDFINLYNTKYPKLLDNRLITALLLLSDIDFLSYLDKIPDYCFNDLDIIKSISIPPRITSIGEDAFSGCTSLTGTITILNTVTSIGSYAFNDCSGLTSITIPSSVISIGIGVFSGCTGLTSVILGSGITSIDSGVFYECRGLTSITIPNGVRSIENSAFQECTGLTSITIPNSVTEIGEKTFSYCSNLNSITFEGTKDEWRKVNKASHWRFRSNIKEIKCIDGVIKLPSR